MAALLLLALAAAVLPHPPAAQNVTARRFLRRLCTRTDPLLLLLTLVLAVEVEVVALCHRLLSRPTAVVVVAGAGAVV